MELDNDQLTVALFQDCPIRRIRHDGRWFYSVIDCIASLFGTSNPNRYWADLKYDMLKYDQIDVYTIGVTQLTLLKQDGRRQKTDCAASGNLFKIIQFIPGIHRRRRQKGPDALSKSGIYAIVNSVTQEKYIGNSRDVPSRFIGHRSDLRRDKHSCVKLQAAWNQYGEDAFIFVLLESVPDESDLEQIEQAYVDTEKPIYNTDTHVTNAGLFAIDEPRIQQFIAFLRDQDGLSLKSVCFQDLHLLIDRRIIMPGPNYHRLSAAEMAGVIDWDSLREFLIAAHEPSAS